MSELSSLRNGAVSNRLSTYQITRHTYRNEGMGAFFRGLGICSARAFVVNAVQWAVSAISSPQVNENTKQEIGIRMDDESASGLNLLHSRYLLISVQSCKQSKELVKHVHMSFPVDFHQLAQRNEAFRLMLHWVKLAFLPVKCEEGSPALLMQFEYDTG